MRAALLIAAMLLTAVPTHPSRADALEDAAKALPLALDDVRTISGWKREAAAGIYRVVAVETKVEGKTISRLFIQWLEVKPDGSRVLTDAFEVKEIEALKARIVDYSHETGEDEIALFIEVTGGNPDDDGSYELFVRSPTDYRFNRISN